MKLSLPTKPQIFPQTQSLLLSIPINTLIKIADQDFLAHLNTPVPTMVHTNTKAHPNIPHPHHTRNHQHPFPNTNQLKPHQYHLTPLALHARFVANPTIKPLIATIEWTTPIKADTLHLNWKQWLLTPTHNLAKKSNHGMQTVVPITISLQTLKTLISPKNHIKGLQMLL